MDWGILLGIVGVVGVQLTLMGIGIGLAVGAAPTRGEFGVARMCFVASAVIMAVSVFLTLWNYPEGAPAVRVVVAAMFGALVFGALAASFDWLNHKQNPPKQGADGAIEGSIFINPQNGTPLPEAFPPDGRLDVLFTSPESMTNGVDAKDPFVVISSMTGIPGSKVNWPEPRGMFAGLIARFEITNDTPSALLELRIPIQVNYGAPPNQRFWDTNIKIPRLDQGAANRRAFYIFNQSTEGGRNIFPVLCRSN